MSPSRALFPALVVLAACSAGSTTPTDETDSCPLPGLGIEVGGFEGARDTSAEPVRTVVLMGGGAEDDSAARAFAEAAGGGDLVILRASGSLTSYPTYFARDVGADPPPASAATVRTTTPGSAAHPSVLCRVRNAEGLWLAGGDQWNYLGLWPDALLAEIRRLSDRGGAIGGTSAGAMVLSGASFDAERGGITSDEALADPLHADVSLSYGTLSQSELEGILVDTHFSERGREGRLIAFLARFLHDRSRTSAIGLGLDEGSALTIEDGRFTTYGTVWVYRLDAPVDLEDGRALSVDVVVRARLDDGASGPWPIDVAGLAGEQLTVVDGVVSLR